MPPLRINACVPALASVLSFFALPQLYLMILSPVLPDVIDADSSA